MSKMPEVVKMELTWEAETQRATSGTDLRSEEESLIWATEAGNLICLWEGENPKWWWEEESPNGNITLVISMVGIGNGVTVIEIWIIIQLNLLWSMKERGILEIHSIRCHLTISAGTLGKSKLWYYLSTFQIISKYLKTISFSFIEY